MANKLQKAIPHSTLAAASRGVLGFTVDAFTGYKPRAGYAVDIGCEQYYENHPSDAEVRAYVRKHQGHLLKAGHYLGGWLSDAGYCLDVSRVYPAGDLGQRAALAHGRYLGEQEICDLSTGACLPCFGG